MVMTKHANSTYKVLPLVLTIYCLPVTKAQPAIISESWCQKVIPSCTLICQMKMGSIYIHYVHQSIGCKIELWSINFARSRWKRDKWDSHMELNCLYANTHVIYMIYMFMFWSHTHNRNQNTAENSNIQCGPQSQWQ